MPLLVKHINLIINLRVWMVCKFYQIKTNEIAIAVTSNTISFNLLCKRNLKFKKHKLEINLWKLVRNSARIKNTWILNIFYEVNNHLHVHITSPFFRNEIKYNVTLKMNGWNHLENNLRNWWMYNVHSSYYSSLNKTWRGISKILNSVETIQICLSYT